MIKIRFNKDIMREAASSGHSTAISAADWITQTLGKPFRESHFIVGKLVKIAEQQGCNLDQLELKQMQDVRHYHCRGLSSIEARKEYRKFKE